MEQDISLIPHFRMEKMQIFQKDELDLAPPKEWFADANPANLYFILTKCKVTIDPDSITINDDFITLIFLIHYKSDKFKEYILIRNDLHKEKIKKAIINYPFNELSFLDENGEQLVYIKSSYFLEQNGIFDQVKNKDFLNYRILYIGQSKTKQNNVPAVSRLLKHSTMQEILDDCIRLHHDKEIFTMIFSIKKTNILDFPENPSDESRKAIIENFLPFWKNPTKQQMTHTINIAEACLINYFKPKYNNYFVNKTLSKPYKSFSEIKKLNVKKIAFGIAFEDFNPLLFTSDQKHSSYEIEIEL